MKGELVRSTITWKQAHFSVAMSRLLQLPHTHARGDGNAVKGLLPPQPPNLLCPRNSLWTVSRGMYIPHGGQHSSVWDCPYTWQYRCLGALYAGPHACRASMRPQAAHICGSDCYIWELHPGSSWVPICLRNLCTHPFVIPPKVVIGSVTLANQVPLMVLSSGDFGESSHGLQKDWILEELDLQGLEEWPKARYLLVKWEYLFAYSNLDLGKTSLIKHQIKLTNQTPFKEL